MSSILAGIRTNIILTESCHGLDHDQRIIVEGIYNEFKPIIEATLTADQINQLFTNIEQGATSAGGNRTMLGKGIDAGKAVNQAIDNVGKWLQNTKPVQAFDQKYEDLKTKISAKFPGLEKNLTAMGTWAKENPGKTAAIIGVLTTVAALAGGPAGGAIAGQILRGTAELLKGEKISTAVGKGVKTAAIGALAGYGIDKIGDMLSGGVRMVADNVFPGARKLNLSFSAYGTGPSTFQNIPDVVGRAEDLAPIRNAFNSASKAWGDGDYSKAASLFQQAKDAAAKLSDPSFVAQLTKDQESRRAIMSGARGIMQASDAFAAAAQGAASGAGEGGLKKQTAESRILSEKEVKVLFEGVMSWLGKKATNLTTKVTADKLMSAWKKAGSPTDSAQIIPILTQAGVSQDVIDAAFKQMQIPAGAAQPAQAAPAQQPNAQATQQKTAAPSPAAQPTAQPATTSAPSQQPAQQQPAQAVPTQQQPAQKTGKPVIKQPSTANNRTAGVRQQGGTFAYNPLAEDAELVAKLEMALKKAREITKGIKYDDTVNGIIAQIQSLAQETGIDPKSIKYAISDVLEAKNNLESAVYGLDEVFKDEWQDAKWKHEDEQEGLTEESKAEIRARLDQAIQDFLDRGGQIEKVKPNRVRAKPGMSMASRHIGTAGEFSRQKRSPGPGMGRQIGGKPVVNVEEEEKKPRTAKALIYQTDMYGAKGYYAQCKEHGCDWKSKSYDRIKQAQDSAKKHGQEHFKVTETHSTGTTIGSAGIGGGSGLGIDKSPMEKVLEKPFGVDEHINSPGGMGQSYRKFRPKDKEYSEVDENLLNTYGDMFGFPKESSIMKGLQNEASVTRWSKENPPPEQLLLNTLIQILMNPQNNKKPDDIIKFWNEKYGLKHTLNSLRQYAGNDYKKAELSRALMKAVHESSKG